MSSEAYTNFSAGVDEETIDAVIARLPSAVSYKALESRTSIDAKLQARFTGSSVQIQATSVQGYGDLAQIRDKHNPMGFSVGSRVDVYARTFTAPSILILQKTAKLIAPNTYQFSLDRIDAPGFYAIRSITEIDVTLSASVSGLPAIGSYAFTEVRSAEGIQDTFHDIDPNNSMIEAAYTVYQQSTVTITGIPASDATHTFKVELFVAPGLTDIQNFFDTDTVRNIEADYIARCPLICLVTMDVKAYHSARTPIDVSQMQQDIVNYINSRSFVPRLTRSELACILHADGATRTDLGASGMMLQGTVRDASGLVHNLSGDSLEIDQIAIPTSLLTHSTVVFAADTSSIFIEDVAE